MPRTSSTRSWKTHPATSREAKDASLGAHHRRVRPGRRHAHPVRRDQEQPGRAPASTQAAMEELRQAGIDPNSAAVFKALTTEMYGTGMMALTVDGVLGRAVAVAAPWPRLGLRDLPQPPGPPLRQGLHLHALLVRSRLQGPVDPHQAGRLHPGQRRCSSPTTAGGGFNENHAPAQPRPGLAPCACGPSPRPGERPTSRSATPSAADRSGWAETGRRSRRRDGRRHLQHHARSAARRVPRRPRGPPRRLVPPQRTQSPSA